MSWTWKECARCECKITLGELCPNINQHEQEDLDKQWNEWVDKICVCSHTRRDHDKSNTTKEPHPCYECGCLSFIERGD